MKSNNLNGTLSSSPISVVITDANGIDLTSNLSDQNQPKREGDNLSNENANTG